MSNKLSFSQLSKYTQCAKAYQYHYVDRIRETTSSAALSFGSAIDDALNQILKDLKKNGSITEDWRPYFEHRWNRVEVNKVSYEAPECTLIGYSKSDFQEELLIPEDLEFLSNRILELTPELKEFFKDNISALKDNLEHKKSIRSIVPFPENEHKVLNLMNWLALRRKGLLMLEAYIRDIIPQIEEVIDIQKKIELGSDGTDTMIGYVDAVVRLKGHEGPIVLDNKTAASPYEANSVFYSQQLNLYSYILDCKKAGFAVMLKNIRMNRMKICSKCHHKAEAGNRAKTCDKVLDKRCGAEWIETITPEGATQLIVDDVQEHSKEMVVDNIAEINHAIHAKVFPRNLNICKNVFGQPCSYINLCHKNKMDGLVKLED